MKQIVEIIGIRNIILYIVIINLLGFFAMGIDKWKAKRGKWRIPEDTLFMFTILGGGLGTTAGIYAFRHKTKKKKFTIGMPVIFILEVILIVYLIMA
jgi:uncharacterized membrane protein YsdA (DUF1294 family)